MSMTHRVANMELILNESATAVQSLRSASDLETRIGVVRDRSEVATADLAAFVVPYPMADPKRRAHWSRLVAEALEAVSRDAAMDVDFESVWGGYDA